MKQEEISAALDHAINALALAKLALATSDMPAFSESHTLRKADLADAQPRASSDEVAKYALEALADVTRRVDELKAADAKRKVAERGVG